MKKISICFVIAIAFVFIGCDPSGSTPSGNTLTLRVVNIPLAGQAAAIQIDVAEETSPGVFVTNGRLYGQTAGATFTGIVEEVDLFGDPTGGSRYYEDTAVLSFEIRIDTTDDDTFNETGDINDGASYEAQSVTTSSEYEIDCTGLHVVGS